MRLCIAHKCLLIVLTFLSVGSASAFGEATPSEEGASHLSMAQDSARDRPLRGSAIEALPILSYDTDVGLGYGVKIFLLNLLRHKESFDVVFFNSTKGERWYKLVFSRPDFEQRQGTVYPLAVDVSLEYDKLIKANFFGVGNHSKFSDREYYAKEPFEMTLTLSRGFSSTVVAQAGVRYKFVRDFNFSESSHLAVLPPKLNSGRVSVASAFAAIRYDTRNSYINPSHGIVLQGEAELAPKLGLGNVSFARFRGWIQHYATVVRPSTILALRVGVQGLVGNELPVQVLLPIGGGGTLRGSPQDRYQDKVSSVLNAELRFPIIWRFGGVAAFDVGKVWHSLNEIDFNRWSTNPTLGLRFYMETFVARMDVGFGKESTGLYFNFGHVF